MGVVSGSPLRGRTGPREVKARVTRLGHRLQSNGSGPGGRALGDAGQSRAEEPILKSAMEPAVWNRTDVSGVQTRRPATERCRPIG